MGTYHHVSQQHLKRHLGELDFRYNERSALGIEDAGRAEKAVKGVVGKILTSKNLMDSRSAKRPSARQSQDADGRLLGGIRAARRHPPKGQCRP